MWQIIGVLVGIILIELAVIIFLIGRLKAKREKQITDHNENIVGREEEEQNIKDEHKEEVKEIDERVKKAKKKKPGKNRARGFLDIIDDA
jgi:hypothetical protein